MSIDIYTYDLGDPVIDKLKKYFSDIPLFIHRDPSTVDFYEHKVRRLRKKKIGLSYRYFGGYAGVEMIDLFCGEPVIVIPFGGTVMVVRCD